MNFLENKNRKTSVLLTAAFAVVACILFVYIISLRLDINAKRDVLEQLNVQYQQQLDSNAELELAIADGDKDEYIERIAREQYGYAKPDERVYYDSSVY